MQPEPNIIVSLDPEWRFLTIRGQELEPIRHVYQMTDKANSDPFSLNWTHDCNFESHPGMDVEMMLLKLATQWLKETLRDDLRPYDPGSIRSKLQQFVPPAKDQQWVAGIFEKRLSKRTAWDVKLLDVVFSLWEEAHVNEVSRYLPSERRPMDRPIADLLYCYALDTLTTDTGEGRAFQKVHIFSTGSDLIGFGSVAIAAGDTIALFKGSLVPAILRWNGTTYTFKGFAYLHNFVVEHPTWVNHLSAEDPSFKPVYRDNDQVVDSEDPVFASTGAGINAQYLRGPENQRDFVLS